MDEQKQRKLIKFNMISCCVILAVFFVMLVGTTIAYFSDRKQTTNTFTAGNAKIELSEAAVKRDAVGNLVEDPDKDRILGGYSEVVNDYGTVYPGQSVYKDPTIKNIGSDAEWIAAKVILRDGPGDLHALLGYEGYTEIDIGDFLTGGLLSESNFVDTWNGISSVRQNENYAMVQRAHPNQGVYEFYFFILKPVAKGDAVTIFEQVVFPSWWNNTEMQHLADLKIDVQAFGVQTFQLESCVKAMTEAFPEHFDPNYF